MDNLPQELASLPNEIILLIFSNIKLITDKRQFLKTCKKYNTLTKQLFQHYEDNFTIKGFDKKDIKYNSHKFVLELCHDNYFNMIPESYIYEDNAFLMKSLAFFGNTIILDRLITITISYYQEESGEDIRHLTDAIKDFEYLICYYAILNDQLDVLIWIKKNHNLSRHSCNSAIKHGKLEILKWLYNNGCEFNGGEGYTAAFHGHVSCLQYLHKKGCAWNHFICSSAAKGGHLSCLKYARENGCPWDRLTYEKAKSYGHTELLNWAVENGCPI